MNPLPPELLGSRILVIDDEATNVRVLERILSKAGCRHVRGTSDPREGLALFDEMEPDLLLLDLRMPEIDGFEVMARLRTRLSEGSYFPILVLTGDLDPETRERALSVGAKDFVTKPFDLTEVLLRIKNLLETRHLHLRLKEQNQTLEERVHERTRELAGAQVEILHRLALAAEYRDDITGRHAERVGVLSALLSAHLGCDDRDIHLIRRAATLHDVGKIGVPDSILMKPGRLTVPEFELMKEHTQIGARILSGSRFPLLRMAREIAASHHERWDGKGYAGLSGRDIPLWGRIVAVADVFDSLSHERPYKQASTVAEAVEYIQENRGEHFDPDVVAAFEQLAANGNLERIDQMARSSLEAGQVAIEAEDEGRYDLHSVPLPEL